MGKGSSPVVGRIQYESDYLWGELGMEELHMYNQGGHHPVHLDDVLDDRFYVVHKLGCGGFGTVWLCRDLKLEKWRAVKVLLADRSYGTTEETITKYLREKCTLEELEANHIMVPLEEFWIEGPNGRHRCLVMPVLGPTTLNWRMEQKDSEEQTGIDAKNVCRQVVEALNFLHGHGICHGDFKPNNILMKVEGIDELDVDEILDLMGEPECYEVKTVSGQSPTPRAPEYCVAPVEMPLLDTVSTKSVAVIDFGESFFARNPPECTSIPDMWAAPEVVFEGTHTLGFPSDVWSLACTLYEIRTGSPLFYASQDGLEHTIEKIEYYLGQLPPDYETAYARTYYGEVASEDLEMPEPESKSEEQLDEIERRWAKRREFIKNAGYSDIFEATLGRERQIYFWNEETQMDDCIQYRYPQDDVLQLADLLRRMLRYNPHERIDTSAIISHPWLRTEPKYAIHIKAIFKSIYENSLTIALAILASALVSRIMSHQVPNSEIFDGCVVKPEELSEPLRKVALYLYPLCHEDLRPKPRPWFWRIWELRRAMLGILTGMFS